MCPLSFWYEILQPGTSLPLSLFIWNHERHLLSLSTDLPFTPLRRLPFPSPVHSILVSFEGAFMLSFSSVLPRSLCCSMAKTGNHGELVCDIHGNLAVVRYEPCPPKSASLHAAVVKRWRDTCCLCRRTVCCTNVKSVKNSVCVCVCTFSSPYSDTLTRFPRASAPPMCSEWWLTGRSPWCQGIDQS